MIGCPGCVSTGSPELAKLRIKEARRLLEAGCPDGAYYLAGYAVECALKACSAKKTERHEFPDRDRAQKSWTHNLVELTLTAELDELLRAEEKQQTELTANWRIVTQWSEKSRYQRKSLAEAKALVAAVNGRKHGVLAWLKRHW